MVKKKKKGIFGEANLKLSKRYLIPSSRGKMVLLGVFSVVLLALFAGFNFYTQDESFASKGPLSSAHAKLQQDCKACHVQFKSVTSQKCTHCHEKEEQAIGRYAYDAHYLYRSNDLARLGTKKEEESCFACHVEHAGRDYEITSVSDRDCLACHKFGSFKAHPEFGFIQESREDATSLKFTHIRHLREVMKRDHLEDTEKACLQCHRPVADERSFEPIQFDQHCTGCHLTRGIKTPLLPIRKKNVPGVETLASIQKRSDSHSAWAFFSNPKEFKERRGKVMKQPIHHSDPWVLENLRMLRTELYGNSGLADLLATSPDVPSHRIKELYGEALRTLRERSNALRSRPERLVQKELGKIEKQLERISRQLQDRMIALDGQKFELVGKVTNKQLNKTKIDSINEIINDLTEPCRECHQLQDATIQRVQKDQRVLYRAEFDHQAHTLQAKCLECHTEISFKEVPEEDEDTAGRHTRDSAGIQNIPGVELCQKCHNTKGASTRCIICHDFHVNKMKHSKL